MELAEIYNSFSISFLVSTSAIEIELLEETTTAGGWNLNFELFLIFCKLLNRTFVFSVPAPEATTAAGKSFVLALRQRDVRD